MCKHATLICQDCGEVGTAAHFLGKSKKTLSPESIDARKKNGAMGGRPRKKPQIQVLSRKKGSILPPEERDSNTNDNAASL